MNEFKFWDNIKEEMLIIEADSREEANEIMSEYSEDFEPVE